MATSDIKKGPLYVDSTNNRVGIGTTGPQAPLDITGSPAGEHGAFIYNSNASGYSAVRLGNSDRGSNGDHLIYGSSAMGIRSKTGANITFEPAGTVCMTIDTSGRVTMPYQPYARCSYSGGNLSPIAIIPLNTNQVTRGGVTIASNRITVPVTGVYMVGYHHLANTGGLQIGVKKNGTAVQGSYAQEVSGANGNFSAQTTVELSANDYIEFEAIANGSLHGNSTYNSMWLFLLG